MKLCLIVQKDTLESDKVKSVVRICDGNPEEYLRELQESHCIEYQLLAYTFDIPSLNSSVLSVITPFKTNYGKDWYAFNHEALSQIISLFLESDACFVNLKSISSIMGFSLKMFPVINKEIVISSISSENTNSNNSNTPVCSSEVNEEIISLIENLDKNDKSEKCDKSDKSVEKSEFHRQKSSKKSKK